jgi:hypothetical protein
MAKDYQKYIVSIELISEKASLAQISAIMELTPSDISHNKGDLPIVGRRPWPSTIWKLKARPSPKLERMIQMLATPLLARHLRKAKRHYRDITVFLNIGILYQGAYSSIEISPNYLDWCSKADVVVQIASYPCVDEEPRELQDRRARIKKVRRKIID